MHLYLFGTFNLVLKVSFYCYFRCGWEEGRETKVSRIIFIWNCYNFKFNIWFPLLLYFNINMVASSSPIFSVVSVFASTKCNCICVFSIRTHSIMWSWWAISRFFLPSHMHPTECRFINKISNQRIKVKNLNLNAIYQKMKWGNVREKWWTHLESPKNMTIMKIDDE